MARRVGILGAGRSGLAAARAVACLGDSPLVYNQGETGSEMLAAFKEIGVVPEDRWSGEAPANLDEWVVSPGVPQDSPILRSALAAGLPVIGEIELAYRVSKAPIVGITGTNGKSTSTVMAYLCARASGLNPILCGNVFGSGYEEVPLAEAALKARSDQLLVAEISSFQLEWVQDFRPISAGITNIWPDHLDRYGGSFPKYSETKHKIFASQGPSEYAVVRSHDPEVKAPKGPQILSYGSGGVHGQVEADAITLLGRKILARDLPFREAHNLQNATLAGLLIYGALRWMRENCHAKATELLNFAEAARAADLKKRSSVYRPAPATPWSLPEEIVKGLLEFRGLTHRMEIVGEKNGIRFVNNSMCTNVDAVLKSAQAIVEPKRLLVGGRNKGLDFKPLKNYLANGRNWAYLYGESAEEINRMMGGGFPQVATMQEAFRLAARDAKPGEVVMLSPGAASMDQFSDFRDRGNVFKQLAMEWIQS